MLTVEQERARDEFRAFADEHVRPRAADFDRNERIPRELIEHMAASGFLLAPQQFDLVTYGLLHEQIGAACSSVRSVLTVHGMVTQALAQWGTDEQKARWMRPLESGKMVGAFALSEPDVGSDARSVRTTATADGDGYVLSGCKKWTTYGQAADLLLVFARVNDAPAAFLVEGERAGLERRPLGGLLGTRAAMLAEITFQECRVPRSALLAKPQFGFAVATAALDYGRYSVAWGCVGIAQACLEASEAYARSRHQFGTPIAEHQLVARMLADMITATRAARLLCVQAGQSKQTGAASSVLDTLVAKYFASTNAMRVASDAVQIHGANGCSDEYPVARYLRDAKTMEIIEGSTQIQQILIARHARG